jgi:effector-binding domain-containing protein
VQEPGAFFDFEICLPVATPVAPANRMKPGLWDATNVAQTTYHGAYEGLGAAWGEFMKSIESAGHKTANGLWERYVIGPETSADPAAWRTELNKPLAEG